LAELLSPPEKLSFDMNVLGRCEHLVPNPVTAVVAISNQRLEVGLLNLDGSGVKLIDRAPVDLSDLVWSPCGTWLAYVVCTHGSTNSVIRIYNAADGEGPFDVTCGRFQDSCPSWDPDGEFLYFVSKRDFIPLEVQATVGRNPNPDSNHNSNPNPDCRIKLLLIAASFSPKGPTSSASKRMLGHNSRVTLTLSLIMFGC